MNLQNRRVGTRLFILIIALILASATSFTARAGDNNILWDYLYHSAQGQNPRTEFVPNQTFTFLSVAPDGNVYPTTNVDIYILVNWLDLSSANIRYWDGAEHWVAMSWVKNITASFHGQPSRQYDLWKGTIPAHGAGSTIYYRIQVNDGSASAYLKAANGTYINPLGQSVRSVNNDADDYSYTVIAGGNPTATPTNTATNAPTFQPPTNTPNGPTATPTATFTKTNTPTATFTPNGSGSTVPSWIQDAVIYQIFPDRFRNGDTSNDPQTAYHPYGPTTCNGGQCTTQFHTNWNDIPNSSGMGIDFWGGDLQGIIDEINAGYFNDLGVNTLYLNPIFESSSNHGYDTNDYYAIAKRFGNNGTFDQLMTAANGKGLRVILDAVFNHAGADSKYVDGYGLNRWPNDLGACESSSSPYRSWFTSGNSGSGCADSWHWNGWSGYETIPEFQETDAVKAFFFSDNSPQSPNGLSVSHFWLNKGIAGFRYDVAQDITHTFFQQMRPYLKSTYGNSDVLMLGEVTGGCNAGLYANYVKSTELDSAMNYCFRDWVKDFANGNTPSNFNNNYQSLRSQLPSANFFAMMNLLSSHDAPRMLNLVGNNKQRLKLAAILQMTLPGAPSVYYGDEVGVTGAGDPDNRRTYPWADKGGSPDTNMYAHFKKLITMRAANSALRGGDVKTLLVDDTNHIYSYLRWNASQKIVVALNNGGSAVTTTISVSADLPNGTVMTDLLNGGTYTVSNGVIVVPVGSQWGVVLKAN